MSKRKRWKLEEIVKGICALCREKPDEGIFGKLFVDEDSGFSVHQYCMFFSSGLAQRGDDEEGFDGYLIKDIKKEITRSKRLKCVFCKEVGASIGCCCPKCCQTFHYKCGKDKGAIFQFFDCFNSFCMVHRPKQCMSWSSDQTCPICLVDIEDSSLCNFPVATPCCKKVLHHECIQHQANSSGLHYFRCPVCNNMEDFQAEMNRMGIFIPERDASWEQGDAFADLLFRYNRCDAAKCVCPGGRDHSETSGHWRIRLCDYCGQNGTHLKCQHWRRVPTAWHCDVCGTTLPYSSTRQRQVGDHSMDPAYSDSESSANEDCEVHICSDSEDNLPLSKVKQGLSETQKPAWHSGSNTNEQAVAAPSPQRKRSRLSQDKTKTEMGGTEEEQPKGSPEGMGDGLQENSFDLFDSSSMTSSLLLAVSDMFVRAVRKLHRSPNRSEKATESVNEETSKMPTASRSNCEREPILIRDTDSECSFEETVELLEFEPTELHKRGLNKQDADQGKGEMSNVDDTCTDSKEFVKSLLNKSYTGGKECSKDSKKVCKDSAEEGTSKDALSKAKSKDFPNASQRVDSDDDACCITKVVKRPCPLGNDKFGKCFLRCCNPLGYCCAISQLNHGACASQSNELAASFKGLPGTCTSTSGSHRKRTTISNNCTHIKQEKGSDPRTEKILEICPSQNATVKADSESFCVEFCSVGTNTPPIGMDKTSSKDAGNQTYFTKGKKPISSRGSNRRLSLRTRKSGSYLERSLKRFYSLRERNTSITHKCFR